MTDFTFQLHIEECRWMEEGERLLRKWGFPFHFCTLANDFPPFHTALSRSWHSELVGSDRVYTYVTRQWKSNKISLLLMQSDGDDDILLCYACEQQLSVSFICIIIIETQIIRRSTAGCWKRLNTICLICLEGVEYIWVLLWKKEGGIVIFIGNILFIQGRRPSVSMHASDEGYWSAEVSDNLKGADFNMNF